MTRFPIYETISILLISALAIAAFLITRATNLWGLITEDPTHQIILSFGLAQIIAFAGLQIALTISQNKLNDSVNKSINQLLGTVREKFDTEIFSTPDEAVKYLYEHLPLASEVIDTSIRHAEKPFKAQDFYSKEALELQKQTFEICMKKSIAWKDIISDNNLEFFGHAIEFDKLSKNPAYKLKVLQQPKNLPFTNFIIIHYANEGQTQKRKSEVLYGWAYSPDDVNTSVFLSRNEKLVRYFEKQADTLFKISQEYTTDYIQTS